MIFKFSCIMMLLHEPPGPRAGALATANAQALLHDAQKHKMSHQSFITPELIESAPHTHHHEFVPFIPLAFICSSSEPDFKAHAAMKALGCVLALF